MKGALMSRFLILFAGLVCLALVPSRARADSLFGQLNVAEDLDLASTVAEGEADSPRQRVRLELAARRAWIEREMARRRQWPDRCSRGTHR